MDSPRDSPSPVSTEEEIKKTVNVWVAQGKSLRIVFFGKTGTGKSSLINSLFGKVVAKEGSSIYAQTTDVKCYTETITVIVDDVRVTLWDTPGLKDPLSDGKKTIKEIQDKCLPNVDLFVYCTKFDQRLGQDDVDCIQDITNAFGAKIWKRTVFALTFANGTSVPRSENKTLEEYFISREREWETGLRNMLKDSSVNPAELPIGKINTIPVVPTGYGDESIPGGRQWFTDFWIACLKQVDINSIPSFIRATGEQADRAATNKILDQRIHFATEDEDYTMTGRMIGHRLALLADKIEKEHVAEKGQALQMADVLRDTIRRDVIWGYQTKIFHLLVVTALVAGIAFNFAK